MSSREINIKPHTDVDTGKKKEKKKKGVETRITRMQASKRPIVGN